MAEVALVGIGIGLDEHVNFANDNVVPTPSLCRAKHCRPDRPAASPEGHQLRSRHHRPHVALAALLSPTFAMCIHMHYRW